MKRSRAAIGTAALTSALTSLAMLAVAPASAAPALSEPIVTGLASPLQFDVDGRRIFVGQTMEEEGGLLTKVRPNGTTQDLHTEPGGEVAGVAVTGDKVAFLTTTYSEEPESALKIWRGPGDVRTIANLWEFEETENPDADFAYGFRGLDKECAEQVPEEVGGGYPYAGIVESHPYALSNAPGGGWYVADAAGNSILKVSRNGDIEVVSVLRPQRLVVTEEMVGEGGMPECTLGKTYAFEAVPTDVEVDNGGQLVVSLLPGGPEDPSLGARGSVVRVDPVTGRSTKIADGFAAATNVALAPKGRIFVSELFGGQISRIQNGKVKPHVQAELPAALEWANGQLYASVEIFGPDGKIVIIERDSDAPVVD